MRVEAVRVEARVGKQRGTGHGRAECAQRARGVRAQRAHRILLHRCDRRRVEQQLVQRGHRLVRQKVAVHAVPLEPHAAQRQHAQPQAHAIQRRLLRRRLALPRRRRLVLEQLKPEALWRQAWLGLGLGLG